MAGKQSYLGVDKAAGQYLYVDEDNNLSTSATVPTADQYPKGTPQSVIDNPPPLPPPTPLYLGKDDVTGESIYYDNNTGMKSFSDIKPTQANIDATKEFTTGTIGPDPVSGIYRSNVTADPNMANAVLPDVTVWTAHPIPGVLPPPVVVPVTPPPSADVTAPTPDAPANPPAAPDSAGNTPPPDAAAPPTLAPPDVKQAEAAVKVASQAGPASTQTAGMASLTPSGDSDPTLGLRVTISQEPALGPLSTVTFVVSPTISENREAEYTPFQPLQHPGEILKYKGTASRSWGVHGKLVSRNADEATQNLQYINMIRSWVMPFYGNGTGTDSDTAKFLGAPPPILTLSAYGPKMIGPVKCVLMSYNWDWPNECDYIYAIDDNGDPVPFPVVVEVTLSLKESWSPAEYSKFDLMQYRAGNMTAAFGGKLSPQESASGSSNDTPAAASNPSAINVSAPQTTSNLRPPSLSSSLGNKLLSSAVGSAVSAAGSFIKTKLGGH